MSTNGPQLFPAYINCLSEAEYTDLMASYADCMDQIKGLAYVRYEDNPCRVYVSSGSATVADKYFDLTSPVDPANPPSIPSVGGTGDLPTDGSLGDLVWVGSPKVLYGFDGATWCPATPAATATTHGTVTLNQITNISANTTCAQLIAKGVPLYANCVDALTGAGLEFLTTDTGQGLYLDGAAQTVLDGYRVNCLGSDDVWTYSDGDWSMGGATNTGCLDACQALCEDVVPDPWEITALTGGDDFTGTTCMNAPADACFVLIDGTVYGITGGSKFDISGEWTRRDTNAGQVFQTGFSYTNPSLTPFEGPLSGFNQIATSQETGEDTGVFEQVYGPLGIYCQAAGGAAEFRTTDVNAPVGVEGAGPAWSQFLFFSC